MPLMRESECSVRSHISCARASISSAVSSTSAPRHGRVEGRPLELAPRSFCSSTSRSALGDVLAQLLQRCRSRASTAKSSSSSGRRLSLTSLTVISNEALAPGELLVAVVGGKRQLDRALSRRRSAPTAPPRSPGSGSRRRARAAGRGPRRPSNGSARAEPLADERADVVDDDEVALLRRRARRSPGARGARASRSISLLDLLLVDLRLAPGDLEALVVRRARPAAARRSRSRTRAPAPAAGRSPRSSSGSPTGTMPAFSIASEYQRDSVSRIASSRTASRPIRWITSGARDLALAKAGELSSRPS